MWYGLVRQLAKSSELHNIPDKNTLCSFTTHLRDTIKACGATRAGRQAGRQAERGENRRNRRRAGDKQASRQGLGKRQKVKKRKEKKVRQQFVRGKKKQQESHVGRLAEEQLKEQARMQTEDEEKQE